VEEIVIGNWLYNIMGLKGTGPIYGFWSGLGSDILEFALIGTLWHMVNCHVKGCWRLGHHVNGTVVCHRHRKGKSMPYEIRQVAGNGYEVINKDTGAVKAKNAIKEDAERQVRLLHAIEHDDEVKKEIADAIAIVREDRFEAFVRSQDRQ
jgi:hypothetical protein